MSNCRPIHIGPERLTHGTTSVPCIDVPRKIRQLIQELEKAGFIDRGGKGSHRNYEHPRCPWIVTISGKSGDDAQRYQERDVEKAIKEIT
jgi:predicted RNA binding protein YcfA (HicA-like mRNA interferase family)